MTELQGEGSYELRIVGESYYQDNLSAICGGTCEEGHEQEETAVLSFEDSNPYDSRAVRVDINGLQVGYLSRQDAATFRALMSRQHPGETEFQCPAEIRGGWDRGEGDQGAFGVRLDLEL